MIKSLIQGNEDLIKEIICISFFMDFILIIIMYAYNKNKYCEIVRLYEKKFGTLPYIANLSKEGSLFLTPALYLNKMSFIMETLLFRYNRVSNHGMSKDGYDYIRSLPNELICGFKIEALLWFIMIPIIISLFIIF